MLEKIKKTIENNNMLDAEDKVLVALSGGADSVCLVLALKELGYSIGAAHVNHKIRIDADNDVKFVSEFCNMLGISLHILEKDVKAVAKEQKISEELAGRNVRYDYFQATATEYGYSKIAVAHNKNDNVETMLLNLLRGSGSKGLCAIPNSRGNVVRPLIDVSRKEIEEYLEEKGQTFVTDKTNFECEYTRNKIRNVIIPHLLDVNQNFIDNASRTIEILKEENEFLDNCASQLVEFNEGIAYINKRKFLSVHRTIKARAIRIAYEYAAGTCKDLEKRHTDYIIETIKEETLGNIIELGFNTLCYGEYERVCFAQNTKPKPFKYELEAGKSVEISECGMRITAQYISASEIQYGKGIEYFDLQTDKLIVRSFNEGDAMTPLGMELPKKLKDIFINQKVPQRERLKKIIIESDEILCVLGVKRSKHYKINNNTEKVLMIKGEKLC